MVRSVIALGTFALTALSAAPSLASIKFQGTFENGSIDHWSKAEMTNPDRLEVVGDPKDPGRKVLKVKVHQGDDPINASGNRNELVYVGDLPQDEDRWYRWQNLWPTDYQSPDTWQLFTQFHHMNGGGSPPVEFFSRGEEIRLRVSGNEVWTHALERGDWHDFVLHVYWSADASKGFVEVWYDGQKVLSRTAAATLFPGQSAYLKQGLYRNETVNFDQTLYQTGAVIGTNMDDVWPQSTSNNETSSSGSLPPISAEQAKEFQEKAGCSTASVAAWPFLAVALAFVMKRMRRRTAVPIPVRIR